MLSQTFLRSAIHAVVQRTGVRLKLTEKQTLLVESLLWGLPRGLYLDGNHVSGAGVKTHVGVILDQARIDGLDFDNINQLRDYLLMHLTGIDAEAISKIQIKAKRK